MARGRHVGVVVEAHQRGARGRRSRGVRAIVFTPQALIARLAALVPAPYMHLRRFYGIFGPHHKLRARILPTPPDPATSDTPVAPKRPKSMTWADLLMPRKCVPETRAVDALRCPHCGGRMRIICVVRDPDAISAILSWRPSTPIAGPTPQGAHPRRRHGTIKPPEHSARHPPRPTASPNAALRPPPDLPADQDANKGA